MFRKAVDRNRARRMLSEAVADAVLLFPENAQLVLFFRGRPERFELEVIKKDVRGLIRTIGVIQRKI
jgi:RNase P protein component